MGKGRRKKPISCGLVRKRGEGATPCPQPKYLEKTMQNVLKRKNMQKYFVKFLQVYPLKPFFPNIFLKSFKNFKYFPLEPIFFYQKHTFYTILDLLTIRFFLRLPLKS